jgi:hypothetical protein
MARQQRVVFYRIIDDDGPAEEQPAAVITIRGGIIYAQSRTVYGRMPIPEGGVTFNQLFTLSTNLRMSCIMIAAQLNRIEFGGAAGNYVAELATLAGADMNRIAENLINQHRQRVIREILGRRSRAIPRLITAESVPEGHTCAVCLITVDETPEDDWVYADGCSLHFFHRECMRPWTGSKCMYCNRQLNTE